MVCKKFALILLISGFFPLFAQDEYSLNTSIIRGEVNIDFELIYAGHVDDNYPLDKSSAGRIALEEAAMLYSAMIYGFKFHYDIGEKARNLQENIELTPVYNIQYGDSAMKVTDIEFTDFRFKVWTDYHLNNSQQNRMSVWRAGTTRNAQGLGFAPSHLDEYPGWLAVKKIALDDAAKTALRAMLRSSERNRPKEAIGFISLASFPRYFMDGGRLACSARFRVQITEIVPFSVY